MAQNKYQTTNVGLVVSLAKKYGGKSGIFITNITTSVPNKTVIITRNDPPNQSSIKSFSTDSSSIDIEVMWERSYKNFVGSPTVNNKPIPIANIINVSGSTYKGNITLNENEYDNLITASLGDTASYVVSCIKIAQPKILSVQLSSPPSPQTAYSHNQTCSISLSSDTVIDAYEIANYGLLNAKSITTFVPSTSVGFDGVTANRGYNTEISVGAKIRVRSSEGQSWSDWLETDKFTIPSFQKLDNTIPSVSFGAISYPSGQQAIKNAELATVNFTKNNCDVVSPTIIGGDLILGTLTGTTLLVTRSANGSNYNINSNNVNFYVKKNSNGMEGNYPTIVKSVNIAPTISLYSSANIRLNESGNVVLSSNQVLISGNTTLTGTNGGTKTTSLEGFGTILNTTVNCSNTDIRRSEGYGVSYSVVGLSALASTGIIDNCYYLKGFPQISIDINYPNNTLNLGTVVDSSKLFISGKINSSPPFEICKTKVSSIPNLVSEYSVTGNILTLADSSTLGGFGYSNAQNITITVEETV